MSSEKSWHEATRWLATSREDLQAAEILQAAGMHAHSCFLAQQSAEKSLKALHFVQDGDPWGHSIQKLMADLPKRPSEMEPWQDFLDKAAALDRFYIPSRYPNGLPDLTPGTTFSGRDSMAALGDARVIVQAAASVVEQPRG